MLVVEVVVVVELAGMSLQEDPRRQLGAKPVRFAEVPELAR